MRRLRRVKILATLGPASQDRAVVKRLLEAGVDVFRIASHCTEADITDRHIGFIRQAGKEAFGVLMMSHMASPAILLEEAKKMESYGAEAIIIMDSAGNYFPDDVTERISTLVEGLSIPVGFHGHNNLGMAVINSTSKELSYVSEVGGVIVEIHEKEVVGSLACSGIYVFSSKEVLLKCIHWSLLNDVRKNGLLYIAPAINYCITKGLRVIPFPVRQDGYERHSYEIG
jgi:hypothetical protein